MINAILALVVTVAFEVRKIGKSNARRFAIACEADRILTRLSK